MYSKTFDIGSFKYKKKTPILHDSGKDLIMTRFENEQQPAAFFYSIHHKNRTL